MRIPVVSLHSQLIQSMRDTNAELSLIAKQLEQMQQYSTDSEEYSSSWEEDACLCLPLRLPEHSKLANSALPARYIKHIANHADNWRVPAQSSSGLIEWATG